MHIKALKTHTISPGEFILRILDDYVPSLQEGTILAITSKIISLCQGRIVSKSTPISKMELIRQECEAILTTRSNLCLTLTNGILIPTAGIDESNGEDAYILYPKEIQETAKAIWNHLRHRDRLKNLGIIITDSHTTPLRRGVTGITLGWCGFSPLYNYIGKPDIHGKPLQVTEVNTLDALAAAAVFVMGEGDEQTPLALISGAPKVEFLNHPPTPEEIDYIKISLAEDLYAPLLDTDKWEWVRSAQ